MPPSLQPAPKNKNERARRRVSTNLRQLPKPRLPLQLQGANLGHHLKASAAAGKQMLRMTLPLVAQNLAVAAGALASVVTLSSSTLLNWSSWSALFQEFAIVGARFRAVVTNQNTPSGFVALFLDEKSAAAPTATDLSKPRVNVAIDASESPSEYTLEWKAEDYADLPWTSTGTTLTPVYLKAFASNAATFTAAATASQLLVNGEVAVDFRGLK